MLGIGTIPSFLLSLCALFLPDRHRVGSSRKGDSGEAKRVLAKSSENSVAAELRLGSLKSALDVPEESTEDVVSPPKRKSISRSLKDLLRWRSSRFVQRALIAAVGVNFFRQATGIDAVTKFRPRFLRSAGIKDQREILLSRLDRWLLD